MLHACVGRCIGKLSCHRLNCSRQRILCKHNSTTISTGAANPHETIWPRLSRLMKRKSNKSLGCCCPAKRGLMKQQEVTMAGSALNASHNNLKSMVSYVESRPTALKTSLVREEEANHMIDEPVVPPAPRNALTEHGDCGGFFFPSPRSVLERRSSSGSFF